MRHLLLGLLAALAALLAPLAAGAPAEETPASAIFPLAEVRPGMRGEVVTVVAGTRTERFEVEVVDVIRNYLPRQDVVLVRCLGDWIGRVGVAQGMSGSPLYSDGRVVGALAYTWPWLKEPLAGITPIEAMLAEARRPLEGRASGAEPPTPLRQRPPLPVEGRSSGLVPIGTSVSVGGFGPEARSQIEAFLAPHGLAVHAAGGGLVAGAPAGWANLDAPLEPGSTLVVDLVRGDLSLAVVGTCTWIEGDKILGFGHSFTGMGETLLPLSVGYVYTIVPTQEMSFKLGASIREIGALIQDREVGIVGVLGAKAPMVPCDVTVRNEGTARTEAYHVEVTANRIYFQRMLLITLADLIQKAEGTLGGNSKRFKIDVKLEGVDAVWSYEDVIAGFDTGMSRVLMGLVDRVLNHPTQRAAFEWVKLDIGIENVDRRATIEAAAASRDQARAGEEVELLVRMRRREGGEIFYERLTVRVPLDSPRGGCVITVTGGDSVSADVASPVDIADIPTLYQGFYKSTELVALVPTGRVDLDVGGRLVRNLPLSALPRLARSTDSTGAQLRPVTEKVRRTLPVIIEGQATVTIDVQR